MKAPVIVRREGCVAYGLCPSCGFGGLVGSSCDVCLDRAYVRALATLPVLRTYGDFQAHGVAKDALLAGRVGAELIRQALPGARFEAPEVEAHDVGGAS